MKVYKKRITNFLNIGKSILKSLMISKNSNINNMYVIVISILITLFILSFIAELILYKMGKLDTYLLYFSIYQIVNGIIFSILFVITLCITNENSYDVDELNQKIEIEETVRIQMRDEILNELKEKIDEYKKDVNIISLHEKVKKLRTNFDIFEREMINVTNNLSTSIDKLMTE